MATPGIGVARDRALPPSAYRAEEFAQRTAPIPDLRDVAPQPPVETEVAAGREDREQEHQGGKEHVAPGPVGRIARLIDAEPQVHHVDRPDDADDAHAEPQDHRNGKGELGEEYEGIEDVDVR